MPALDSLVAASLLTLLNFALLTCFDQLAFRSLGLRVARWRIGVVSFLGYAISNCVGPAAVVGSAVRYRYYSRWGLTAEQIARVVVLSSSTFWLGPIVLGGATLATAPVPAFVAIVPRPWLAVSGAALFLLAGAYALLPLLRVPSVRVGPWTFPVPGLPTVLAQFLLSTADWVLAAAVLWVLLPAPRPAFVQAGGAFIGAQVVGLVSHLPGGAGVFDSLMVLFMAPSLAPSALLPALIAYRAIYYLVPLAVAVTAITVDESRRHRRAVGRLGARTAAIGAVVAPRILAVATFAGGAILLFSGATPAVAARLSWLGAFVPSPLLEASHFLGSVIGVVLLLLSRAVARRIDAAWNFSVAGLGAGIAVSLLKGGDYEEAAVLAVLFAGLLAARRTFDRKAALFDVPLSAPWFAGIVGVVAASIFLGIFAFRHVAYAHELWWQFALEGDAPRFLRASVGAGVTILAFGVRYLLKPAPPALRLPGDGDLVEAGRVIARQPSVYPNLALLGDKALLWNADRSGFVMYGVHGGTWVALHDPVVPPASAPALVRMFLNLVDKHGGVPVFYEIGPALPAPLCRRGLHPRQDRRGSAGAVGSLHARRRRTQGVAGDDEPPRERAPDFRMLPGTEVRTRLGELRRISDDWLQQKAAAEKGFSLGFFDPAYLERFPLAVLERDGRVEVFANLWRGAGRQQLSVDLARYRAGAPSCAMEGLFLHVMQWGREHGYAQFSLGVAPLSGLEPTTLGPPWSPVARLRVHARRTLLPFPGSACVQGEVPSRVGAALPRPSRRLRAGARRCRRVSADCRRLPPHLLQGELKSGRCAAPSRSLRAAGGRIPPGPR